MKYEKCRKLLTERQTSLRCREVLKVLKDLGFKVKDASGGGHKLYRHPAIHDFFGSNFNCGHNSGDVIKANYIKSMLNVIEQYETEIKEFLGE